ncbi:hypothetical protein Trydic_g2969 [Trypoxylus dichotomus]
MAYAGCLWGFKVHYMKSADNSKPVRAAVVVADAGLRGITLTDKSGGNLVSVEVSNGLGLRLIIVSRYLPPEERHVGEFAKLRNVIGELNWSAPRRTRGRKLETVFEDNSLVVLNNNEEPTFVGHRRSSFIDFTAVNFRAYGMIDGWHLSDDETLSDHGLIGFGFGGDADSAHRQTVKKGFCAKKGKLGKVRESFLGGSGGAPRGNR